MCERKHIYLSVLKRTGENQKGPALRLKNPSFFILSSICMLCFSIELLRQKTCMEYANIVVIALTISEMLVGGQNELMTIPLILFSCPILIVYFWVFNIWNINCTQRTRWITISFPWTFVIIFKIKKCLVEAMYCNLYCCYIMFTSHQIFTVIL